MEDLYVTKVNESSVVPIGSEPHVCHYRRRSKEVPTDSNEPTMPVFVPFVFVATHVAPQRKLAGAIRGHQGRHMPSQLLERRAEVLRIPGIGTRQNDSPNSFALF